MHIATHLLGSWTLADSVRLEPRDRKLVTWCGALPDLDGAGLIVDGVSRAFGAAPTAFYAAWHHTLLHGLAGAILLSALLACLARRRLTVFFWGLLVTHVHLLCDLVGSRGPLPVDVWPVAYLAPFSTSLTLRWSGQWPINGWPNILLTVALLAVVFVRAYRRGYSPVSLFSERADRVFVETIRRRWKRIAGLRE